MTKKAKYDIFISYRRTAYDTANLIAEKLRNAGYRVFFDIDTLTSGKFNEQLLEVIGGCKDFILVLPENALERCADENDWIRREVMCALENKKNIIPVMLDGFAWPSELPKGMEELPNYQAIAAVNREFFDMAITRLKGYLKSKPVFPLRSMFVKGAIILVVLFAILGVGYGVLHRIAKVTSEEIAIKQSSVMNYVDLLASIRKDLAENIDALFIGVEKNKDEEDCLEIEENTKRFIKSTEKEINSYLKKCPAPDFNLQWRESLAMSFYGINSEELNGFSAYYESLYEDLEEIIEFLKETMEKHDYSTGNKLVLDTGVKCLQHSINAFYYGYLGSLSLLPKSARKPHYEMAKRWMGFPNGTPLDLPQEEYEQFQLNEMNQCQEEMEQLSSQINYEDNKLDELEKQLEDLSDDNYEKR